jgi:hypothetical protein
MNKNNKDVIKSIMREHGVKFPLFFVMGFAIGEVAKLFGDGPLVLTSCFIFIILFVFFYNRISGEWE